MGARHPVCPSVRRGVQAGRATRAGPHARGDCGNGGDCGNRRAAAPSPAQKDVWLSAAHFRRGTRPERMRGRSVQRTLQESGDPSPAGRGAGGPLALAELTEAVAKGLEGPGKDTPRLERSDLYAPEAVHGGVN